MSKSLGTPLIETFNLKKDYEMPNGALPILKGIDLELFAAQMTFIVGRSGSGKSTLLHLLGGLDVPTSGKVYFQGEDLSGMSEKEIARLRNLQLGFVFQFFHLLPELTLFENVLLPTMIAGKEDKKWVKETLKRVKLWSRKDHYPSELSGGEQQRAAIARALVNKPAALLCDEPTGNLDEETAKTIYELLFQLNQQYGQAAIIVTHDDEWPLRNSQVLRLQDGMLIRENRGEVHVEQPF